MNVHVLLFMGFDVVYHLPESSDWFIPVREAFKIGLSAGKNAVIEAESIL